MRSPRNHEASGLVFDDGFDLGLPVADAFVLHQYGPAELGAVLDPAGVLDLFVFGYAVVFGQGDQIPTGSAKQSWDSYSSQTAVDEELRLLLGWRHGARPRLRLC
ncbi:hypothetical protein GCM10009555_090590 [Acrocarpospora macrocephala]|uniref:Uncharacterized protein n=1 Tax=Acrocarpospora macrocephala TaxID=150177 RepID=A0A5M3WIP2_9ACTN|nr:hypothetical protein Amac_026310 [Acrocarpospora macrocephala]